MSKSTQIQTALRSLGGGSFHKLADEYLYKKGYERINPIGAVVGADKSRSGTPDSLVSRPDGKFVFAEYSTQQDGLFEKLMGDIEKCLDESKTGIPVEKIEEIVICHTSVLSAREEESLANVCRERGVNLNIYGIGPISHDLYQKYRGLAHDFLGVNVDSGQIVPMDEFVQAHQRSKFSTPLNNALLFRDEEMASVIDALDRNDLVYVTGRAGVGKTRFALELCAQFLNKYPEYGLRCILNHGPSLYEDLRVHFAEPGSYLILVDDANRTNNFEYVLQILNPQNEDNRVKVIATVRDYALEKVRDVAKDYSHGIEVALQALTDEQIVSILRDEFDIKNTIYLDRITDIAMGNPRLAIMAAMVAKRENALESISDVSALFDEYFRSIRQDVKGLGSERLERAAGIVAFFRVVDKSNAEMMAEIATSFEVDPVDFWQAVTTLHELEVVDVYENEIVRVSDQVLAVYFFYLAFFKDKALHFSVLLERYFPSLRHRLTENLYPVMNAFGRERITRAVSPDLGRLWNKLEIANDHEALLSVMDIFWFMKQTDTLSYIRSRILEMEPREVDPSELDFRAAQSLSSPSLLSVLASFRRADDDRFRIAIGLVLDYLQVKPESLPEILYLLDTEFGFRHTSYLRGFVVQRAVIDALSERAKSGRNRLYSKLFLEVAKQYSRTRYHSVQTGRQHTVNIIDFHLPPTPELLALRRELWKGVFDLHQIPEFELDALGVLQRYSGSGFEVTGDEIVAEDSKSILQFIESALKPELYRHCVMVQEYLDLLDTHSVRYSRSLRNKFRNDEYDLSRLLLAEWPGRKNLDMDYAEYVEFHRSRIREHFTGYELRDYEDFLNLVQRTYSDLLNDEQVRLRKGASDVFVELCERDPHLYQKVLSSYLERGDPLNLNPALLVANLIASCGADTAYELLAKPEYDSKRAWLLSFHSQITEDAVTPERLDALYALLFEAEPNELPFGIDFLLTYLSLDDRVVIRATEILIDKADEHPQALSALAMIFYPNNAINNQLGALFSGRTDLLKRIYFGVAEVDRHADYDGRNLAIILQIDPDFILEYLEWVYGDDSWPSRQDYIRDFSFIWLQDDHAEVMGRVINFIYRKEQGSLSFLDTLLEAFFGIREGGQHASTILARQTEFLLRLIENRSGDTSFMMFLFGFISGFPPASRRRYIASFLKANRNFEAFQKIPLEPSSRSWSGSAIPMLQERLDYLDSLLSLVNTAEYLPHRQHIERRMSNIREEMELHKRMEFIED